MTVFVSPSRAASRTYWLSTLAFLCLLGAFISPALAQNPPAKPPTNKKLPVVPIATYERQLRQADARLKALEGSTRRPLKPILNALSQPQKVRRADGSIIEVNGGQWQRRARELTTPQGNASRQQVAQTRAALHTYLGELNAWRNASYSPPEAQGIVRQLENTGQIRTGPTRFEQWKADLTSWVKEAFRSFTRWLEGLLPTASPGNMPNFDPRIIQVIFYMTIAALALILLYLIWRVLRVQLGKRGAQREVRFLSGEDAELLQLPPDELRSRAERFAQEGNFREALRHRFISLLVTLDTHGVWQYDTRRTNWEHIAALNRQTKSNAALAAIVEPLSGLTHRFDRVRYGNAACSCDEWGHFSRVSGEVEAVARSSGGAGSTSATS